MTEDQQIRAAAIQAASRLTEAGVGKAMSPKLQMILYAAAAFERFIRTGKVEQ